MRLPILVPSSSPPSPRGRTPEGGSGSLSFIHPSRFHSFHSSRYCSYLSKYIMPQLDLALPCSAYLPLQLDVAALCMPTFNTWSNLELALGALSGAERTDIKANLTNIVRLCFDLSDVAFPSRTLQDCRNPLQPSHCHNRHVPPAEVRSLVANRSSRRSLSACVQKT